MSGVQLSLLLLVISTSRYYCVAIVTKQYDVNATLRENCAIGSRIYDLAELGLTTTDLGVLHSTLNKYEFIDYSNLRYIRTKDTVDRELLCPGSGRCELMLGLVYTAPKVPRLNSVNIRLHVVDENDNRPRFEPDVCIRSAREGFNNNLRIPLPLAVDLDTKEFGIRAYRLEGNSEPFVLHQDDTQVYLTTSEPLDRETIDEYHFKLIAMEIGNDYTTALEVNVKVTDIDDNPPIFAQSEYHVNIVEGIFTSQLLVTIQANDSDIGANAAVVYSISGPQLSVDALTGEVKLTGNIDAYETPTIRATLTATNPSSLATATTEIIVTVQDINDHRPRITLYGHDRKFLVPEVSRLDQFVAKLHVSDADRGVYGEFHCSMTHIAFRLHAEDKHNFMIYTTQSVYDRETISHYNLTVTCWDGKETFSRIVFTVWVEDVNDNPPIFSQPIYRRTLTENTDIEEILLTLVVSDLDIGLNAEVEFSVEQAYADLFSVDPVKGHVRSRYVLDYENEKEVQFIVIATDNGSPQRLNSTAVVKLTIEDTDDQAPVFSSGGNFHFFVTENSPENTFVGTVLATDADSPRYAQFTLTLLPDSDDFRLDPVTGNVYTKRPLDRETTASYRLQAQATPSGGHASSRAPYAARGTVEVKVIDVNDNRPLFAESNGTVRLSLGLKTGMLVATVRATDRDVDSRIRYQLISGDPRVNFALDPRSGRLRLARPLRYSSSTDRMEFQLTLRAYDGLYSDERSLRVEVVEAHRPASGLASTSGQNLVIVVAIATVSSVAIVTLSIAIAVVCRQRRRDTKGGSKEGKRPLAGAIADLTLSGSNSPSDQDLYKVNSRPEMSYHRNSLTSVNSHTSSLQLTNSFVKIHYPTKSGASPLTSDLGITSTGVQGLPIVHSKDSDSGCSADMSSTTPWNLGQSTHIRDQRSSSQCSPPNYYAPPTSNNYAPSSSNHYDNMSDYSNNRNSLHGMQV